MQLKLGVVWLCVSGKGQRSSSCHARRRILPPPQAGAPSSGGDCQPRLFSSILSSVLVRAPLRLGLLFLEPPLLVGAADYLLAPQLEPVAREKLAALAEAARWRRRFGPDDDVHILWQSLVRRMPSFSLAAGSLHGCLDSSFVRTVRDSGCSCPKSLCCVMPAT